MESYTGGIGITAGSLMLKWHWLDEAFNENNVTFTENDSVNVFISLESVLRNISLYKNISTVVFDNKQSVSLELESSILNLIANYKMYFKRLNCRPIIYLYCTDFDTSGQQMKAYNKFYRTYYMNEYLHNPKTSCIGGLFTNVIFNDLSTIISYVPDCHFVKTNMFDASLVPKIISESNNNHNVIITSDLFDTLYMYNINFTVFYIKRRFSAFSLSTQPMDIINSMIDSNDSGINPNIFQSMMLYKLLLVVKGMPSRNIKSPNGFGIVKFMKSISADTIESTIIKDLASIHSIIKVFPCKYRNEILTSFKCLDIDIQHSLLGEYDINSVMNSLVNHSDVTGLESLNNVRFLEYPINISGLLQ